MSPLALLGGLLALLGALAGAYVGGRRDGAAIVRGGELRAVIAEQALADRRQADIDASSTRHADEQQQRAGGVREIWHETEKFIDRPVYSAVGVDADGVRALDRAAAIANGQGEPGAARAAAAVADSATIDGRQCLASLLELYDVAGGIRSDFAELQRQVSAGASAAPPAAAAPAREGR